MQEEEERTSVGEYLQRKDYNGNPTMSWVTATHWAAEDGKAYDPFGSLIYNVQPPTGGPPPNMPFYGATTCVSLGILWESLLHELFEVTLGNKQAAKSCIEEISRSAGGRDDYYYQALTSPFAIAFLDPVAISTLRHHRTLSKVIRVGLKLDPMTPP